MLENTNIPRFVIGAFRGGAGKTFVTVGLTAALRRRGLSPAVFKKGPDYIDSGWLGLSSEGDCYNLDPYLFDEQVILRSFVTRSVDRDIAIIEGNRGIFDGVDSAGTYSTAELAKLLKAPVILLIDVTKMTRTAAALVVGCQTLDPNLNLNGVILNRVGGDRHERVLRQAIEDASSIPVIGSVRKLNLKSFPQRHLGLLPWHEHPQAVNFVNEAARVAETFIDLDRIIKIAQEYRQTIYAPSPQQNNQVSPGDEQIRPRIGVLRDAAFQFYYPENLETLVQLGAEVINISALTCDRLPELDALYIGGGFPETHAESLAQNSIFRNSVAKAAQNGLPIYAECGGLMYLSSHLIIDKKQFPMTGVFPIDAVLNKRPQGHGYIQALVDRPNPFFPVGIELVGHEFHYSYISYPNGTEVPTAFQILRGHGIDGQRDGIFSDNVLATYLHVHALGTPIWAESLIRKARGYLLSQQKLSQSNTINRNRAEAI